MKRLFWGPSAQWCLHALKEGKPTLLGWNCTFDYTKDASLYFL